MKWWNRIGGTTFADVVRFNKRPRTGGRAVDNLLTGTKI
jgi:hypothetical protein